MPFKSVNKRLIESYELEGYPIYSEFNPACGYELLFEGLINEIRPAIVSPDKYWAAWAPLNPEKPKGDGILIYSPKDDIQEESKILRGYFTKSMPFEFYHVESVDKPTT